MVVIITPHNAFRLAGDFTHVLAIFILLAKICISGSCAGISAKSQWLYLFVFTARYLDLVLYFISVYNSAMKILFILASCCILYLIHIKYSDTYDKKHDTFRIEYLLGLAFCLALFFNYGNTIIEVLWAFSIYLEAVVIVPQLYMIFKTGKVENIIAIYLFTLASYRGFYILNWICRYYEEHHYNLLAIFAGCAQTFVYFGFFYVYHITKIIKSNNDSCKLKEKTVFTVMVDEQKPLNVELKKNLSVA